jgi:hypothetical protein
MDSNWAAEHLQVIRTLMERTAVYRRALAPIMLTTGVLGCLAGALGWRQGWDSPRAFAAFWLMVCFLCIFISLLLVRRQALRDSEPFWSPPTRRVTEALLPAFFAGFMTVIAMFLPRWGDSLHAWWLPTIWMIIYGCASHAAGFFMPRGIRLLGWLFILAGSGLFIGLSFRNGVPPLRWGHAIMGGAFGGLHLAYGVYLYLTERSKNAA